jgi:hypothetical protein
MQGRPLTTMVLGSPLLAARLAAAVFVSPTLKRRTSVVPA